MIRSGMGHGDMEALSQSPHFYAAMPLLGIQQIHQHGSSSLVKPSMLFYRRMNLIGAASSVAGATRGKNRLPLKVKGEELCYTDGAGALCLQPRLTVSERKSYSIQRD